MQLEIVQFRCFEQCLVMSLDSFSDSLAVAFSVCVEPFWRFLRTGLALAQFRCFGLGVSLIL